MTALLEAVEGDDRRQAGPCDPRGALRHRTASPSSWASRSATSTLDAALLRALRQGAPRSGSCPSAIRPEPRSRPGWPWRAARWEPAHWRRRDDEQALLLNRRGRRLSRQSAWNIVKGYGARGADRPVPVLRHSLRDPHGRPRADIRAVQGAARPRVDQHDPGVHEGVHRGGCAGLRRRPPWAPAGTRRRRPGFGSLSRGRQVPVRRDPRRARKARGAPARPSSTSSSPARDTTASASTENFADSGRVAPSRARPRRLAGPLLAQLAGIAEAAPGQTRTTARTAPAVRHPRRRRPPWKPCRTPGSASTTLALALVLTPRHPVPSAWRLGPPGVAVGRWLPRPSERLRHDGWCR